MNNLKLLTFAECQTHQKLIDFINNCAQLKGFFEVSDLEKFLAEEIESLKRKVFLVYQDTLIPHNSSDDLALDNVLNRLNIKEEDVKAIKKPM